MARTKEFSNLPRKYKMSVSGCRHRCAQPEINDLSLVGHVHPDGREGFDLLVGGGLSSSPRFADRLGVFVPRAEAPEVVAAATSAYRDHGNRDKRTRARIKFLLAAWGPERFREVVERDYLGRPLEDGPEAPPSPDAHRDHVGVHRQLDGRSYVGVSPLVGRTDGDTLVEVAELARELAPGGSGSPPSRSWSCWTCPTSGSTRRWAASTSWPCPPSPASSTGARWPAPA